MHIVDARSYIWYGTLNIPEFTTCNEIVKSLLFRPGIISTTADNVAIGIYTTVKYHCDMNRMKGERYVSKY